MGIVPWAHTRPALDRQREAELSSLPSQHIPGQALFLSTSSPPLWSVTGVKSTSLPEARRWLSLLTTDFHVFNGDFCPLSLPQMSKLRILSGFRSLVGPDASQRESSGPVWVSERSLLYVLLVPAWLFSKALSFLPQSKNTQMAEWCVCPVIDW